MDVTASCVLPNNRATLCVLVTSQLPHLTLGVSQLKHRRHDMLSGSVVVAAASWQGLDILRTLDPHWPDFKKSTKRLRLSIVAGCLGGGDTDDAAAALTAEWWPSLSTTTRRASPRLKAPRTLGGKSWCASLETTSWPSGAPANNSPSSSVCSW